MEEDFVFNYRLHIDGKLVKDIQMTFCDNKVEDHNINAVLSKMQEFLNAVGYDIAKLEARKWTNLK